MRKIKRFEVLKETHRTIFVSSSRAVLTVNAWKCVLAGRQSIKETALEILMKNLEETRLPTA